jgi:hypothetical protein
MASRRARREITEIRAEEKVDFLICDKRICLETVKAHLPERQSSYGLLGGFPEGMHWSADIILCVI